jgi:hypothetical protein
VPLLLATDAAAFDAADANHSGTLSQAEMAAAGVAAEEAALPQLVNIMDLSVSQMVTAMKVLCFLQVGASFVALVVNLNDKQNADAVSMGQSVFASVTGLVTGVAGVYGAAKRDRGALTFFFVVEMWVLLLLLTTSAFSFFCLLFTHNSLRVPLSLLYLFHFSTCCVQSGGC